MKIGYAGALRGARMVRRWDKKDLEKGMRSSPDTHFTFLK